MKNEQGDDDWNSHRQVTAQTPRINLVGKVESRRPLLRYCDMIDHKASQDVIISL